MIGGVRVGYIHIRAGMYLAVIIIIGVGFLLTGCGPTIKARVSLVEGTFLTELFFKVENLDDHAWGPNVEFRLALLEPLGLYSVFVDQVLPGETIRIPISEFLGPNRQPLMIRIQYFEIRYENDGKEYSSGRFRFRR